MDLDLKLQFSKTIVVIAGPTASGKSSLALKIAEKYNGIIINADSVQVYKDLEILSSRPSRDAFERVPHKLYGFLEGNEFCSAGLWRSYVLKEIQNCYNIEKLPIIVGGTGLYLKALIEGLSPIPTIDMKIRELARQRMQEEGSQGLYQELESLDPAIAIRLNPSDSQRIVRAWEVVKSTGIPLSEWQLRFSNNLNKQQGVFKRILLMPPREQLNIYSDKRLEAMVELGLLNEVEKFLQKAINPSSTIYKAIGLREFIAYLNNEMRLEESLEKAKIATHQYIKRQYTWFKHQFYADVVIDSIGFQSLVNP